MAGLVVDAVTLTELVVSHDASPALAYDTTRKMHIIGAPQKGYRRCTSVRWEQASGNALSPMHLLVHGQ
jgi:hypothetical protein